MDRNKRRLTQWTIPGVLLLLACFSNLCAGEDKPEPNAKELAAKTGDLKCYVCNSQLGPCDNVTEVKKIACKEYFQTVYGTDGESNGPLKNWPASLSELALAGKSGGDSGGDSGGENGTKGSGAGWSPIDFPGRYEKGKDMVSTGEGHRFSGLGNIIANGEKTLDKGFQSCKVMKISVDNQVNGGQAREVAKTHPNIIRTCSFADADEKTGKDSFDEKGCRVFNYKSAAVEVCYCKGDGCNGSSYLRVSLWMIAASTLLLLAQTF